MRVLPLAPGRRPWRAWHARRALATAPRATAVVLTRPDQSALLPHFSGRRIYFAIDDYETYGRDWAPAELTLLRGVDHVVAVSSGLARKLAPHLTPGTTISVCPNAIPADWVPAGAMASVDDAARRALRRKLGLPTEVPLAGVLGRISSRLRLDWVLAAVEAEPWLHWVFAGDVEDSEVAREDRARIVTLQRHPRIHVTGRVPFAAMRDYAAALDVAVLPYSDRSTNPLGSAVRLFVHLPHPAPLLATDGCRQVRELAPELTFFHSGAELAAALRDQRERGFADPAYPERLALARQHTWEARAREWATWVRA